MSARGQQLTLAAHRRTSARGRYGEADQGIPVAQVEAMKAALASAGKMAEFKIDPRAPHGFRADYPPELSQGCADDAWAQMTAWFRKNGVLS